MFSLWFFIDLFFLLLSIGCLARWHRKNGSGWLLLTPVVVALCLPWTFNLWIALICDTTFGVLFGCYWVKARKKHASSWLLAMSVLKFASLFTVLVSMPIFTEGLPFMIVHFDQVEKQLHPKPSPLPIQPLAHPIAYKTKGVIQGLDASHGPIFIDFGYDGCLSCRKEAPIVLAASQKYAGRLRFVSIDAVENSALVDDLGIDGFPTAFFVYQDGHSGLIARVCVGFQNADELDRFIGQGFLNQARAIGAVR